MKKRMQGFTLLELMVVLVIVGLLFGIGIPSFNNAIRNARITSAANDMLAAIHSARAEAIKRRAVTVACSSNNATVANPSCGAGRGWIVFVDLNDDLAVTAGEEVLLQREAMPATITPRPFDADGAAIAGGWTVAFRDNGMAIPTGGTALRQLVLCDDRGNVPAVGDLSAARLINVTPVGRPSVLRDVGLIEDAGGCT